MSLQLSKRQQQRNEQILHGLLKEKGNSKCADCNAPNPSWASYNLGIFLCVRCAAIHRKIGTHISKIKSLTLDKWNPEQISTMRAMGNTQSNEKYNPNHKPPPTTAFSGGDATEDIELERYIRDKYERKTFMKTGKKLPPSPTFHRDPDKITAILGPPAARSPSLGSSSSGNLKPGQRVSGESFEGARSPASTNSSVEVSTRHGEQDPWAWAGLETKNVGAMQTVYEGQSQGNGNPFQNSIPAQPQPVPKPLPQVTPFPPPPKPNPFNLGETNFDSQRKETISQETQYLLDSASSPFQRSSSNGQGSSQPLYSQSQQTVYPRSPSGQAAQAAQISSPNPFVSQQVQSPAPMSPTNPFFAPQPAQSPFTPVYQPQQQQSSYQSQPQQPQSSYQQPQPPYQQPQSPYQQPQQPQYQHQQPLYQQQHQQPQQPQQQPQQSLYQSSPPTAQPQYQQYQPQPQPTQQPFNPNTPFTSPRMDKQSILNLFNTQPNPQPQILNQNGVPAWTQQSNGW